ncbi:MAG: YciI family protein [Candidatus Dormibacterales bacterium]
MAKFIFLQYIDESKAPRPGSPELTAVIDAFAKYLEELKTAGAFHEGDPCQPSAAGFCVSVRDGQAKTTDGPMHSASPWLNGYFVLNCKDRSEAVAWAAKNPAAFVGTVEVHPILTLM